MTVPEHEAGATQRVEDALKLAEAEGGGVWSMSVYPMSMVPKIMRGAEEGHPKAVELADIVRSVVSMIANATLGPDNPPICFTCETTFTPTGPMPDAIVDIHASSPDAKHHVLGVLCQSCHRHPEVAQRILQRVRANLIPDARQIVIGEAGHA